MKKEIMHSHKRQWTMVFVVGIIVVVIVALVLAFSQPQDSVDGQLSEREKQAILEELAQTQDVSDPLSEEDRASILSELADVEDDRQSLSGDEKNAILNQLQAENN